MRCHMYIKITINVIQTFFSIFFGSDEMQHAPAFGGGRNNNAASSGAGPKKSNKVGGCVFLFVASVIQLGNNLETF